MSVVDRDGITYTRIWCVMEIWLGLGKDASHEVYTARECCGAFAASQFQVLHHEATQQGLEGEALWQFVFSGIEILETRPAVGLTDGPCAADNLSGTGHGFSEAQTLRQSYFPAQLLHRAFKIRVQTASASVETDKTHILNYISSKGKATGHQLAAEVDYASATYEEMNVQLHGMFAAAGWRVLLELEQGASMQQCAAVLAKPGPRKLHLSFDGCQMFDDDAACLLLSALPPTLEHLALQFGSTRVTASVGQLLFDLIHERLSLSGIRQLSLNSCKLTALPQWLPQCNALEMLNLYENEMVCCIPKEIGSCSSLRTLKLGCNHLHGTIPHQLGECLALELLHLSNNELTGEIPKSLGNCRALKEIDVRNNQLGGLVPEELGLCTNLEWLQVCGNSFRERSIPQVLKGRPNLLIQVLSTEIGNTDSIGTLGKNSKGA